MEEGQSGPPSGLEPPIVSGDGFVTLPDGDRRWGLFGAAGVLVRHVDRGEPWYLVALRSPRSHRGGTWAVPGGALNRDESPIEGALREFNEEIGVSIESYEVVEMHEDDHGGWSYWTILVDVAQRFELPESLPWETAEARWVAGGDLGQLDLFDAFHATLRRLRLI